jgi:hypothetical protein
LEQNIHPVGSLEEISLLLLAPRLELLIALQEVLQGRVFQILRGSDRLQEHQDDKKERVGGKERRGR